MTVHIATKKWINRDVALRRARTFHGDRSKRFPLLPTTIAKSRLPAKLNLFTNAGNNPFLAAYDQGQIGSCTANALCWCIKYMEVQAKQNPPFDPSRLELYYFERRAEVATEADVTDSGADAADGLLFCQKVGVCAESFWPYDESKVNMAPPVQVGKVQKTAGVYSLNNDGSLVTQIKKSLASNVPVVIGMLVTDEIMTTVDGHLKRFSAEDYASVIGGHEVVVVGYDDSNSTFTFMNSWGSGWGSHGTGTLPQRIFNRMPDDQNWIMDMGAVTKL